MARKNRNSIRGKNSGRKFDGRDTFEELDTKGLLMVLNSARKVPSGLDRHAMT